MGCEKFEVALDQRVEDLLTVGEEAVERRHVDAGAIGDDAGGHGIDPALVDEARSRVQDALDGFAAACLHRLASPRPIGPGRVCRRAGRFRGLWGIDGC